MMSAHREAGPTVLSYGVCDVAAARPIFVFRLGVEVEVVVAKLLAVHVVHGVDLNSGRMNARRHGSACEGERPNGVASTGSECEGRERDARGTRERAEVSV